MVFITTIGRQCPSDARDFDLRMEELASGINNVDEASLVANAQLKAALIDLVRSLFREEDNG